jgi:mono/diheme cytochrome c family protein
VWLFGLDGTLGPVQPGTPVNRNAAPTTSENRAPGAGTPAVAALRAPANLENGRQLFLKACVVCHGEDGKSGHGAAPSLAEVKDLDLAMQTVTTGRNTMPAFRGDFTAEQIRDIGAFVVQVLAGQPPR